jgi:putative tricarboxylic transport membrane protein
VDLLSGLWLGVETALSLQNLFFCLVGAFIGTLVGVLPGLGPVTTIAMLLPVTFSMSPVSALIMLSGIYYGANHAGATTSIVLNMPGEPAAVVACFDGHPMARQGRAGVALAIAAFASFFAGLVGVALIVLFAPMLSAVALNFGAPEYASMIFLAIVATATLTTGSLSTTVPMAMLGMILATIGTDVNSGVMRFTFGVHGLADGLDFAVLAVGLFGLAEMALRMADTPDIKAGRITLRSLIPAWDDVRRSALPVIRGTAIGSLLGVLPGTGPLVSSFASYSIEKQLAKDPSRFGRGAIEGVAGPEAAANAAAITHFIPMLTLGIPAGATMALLLGAMMIQGVPPGPNVMTSHPSLFWGIIVSMVVGNAMLLVLNLPMIGIWLKLLSIPYRYLYPAILAFCCIGIYSVDYSSTLILITALFGVFGYLMSQIGCPPAPLLLGFVLEPVFEENFRRALLISDGEWSVFITQPISAGFLVATVALVGSVLLPGLQRRRKAMREAAQAAK